MTATKSLAKAPAFSRVRVRDFGSVTDVSEFPHALDDVMAIWTRCVDDDNPFATADLRGIVGPTSTSITWLPSDAVVEIVEPPRYAGQPEDLIKQATPVEAPEGSKGVMKTADGWPPLIWESDLVHSPVQNWVDAELAVETLMCALTIAPETDPALKPMLLAALKARYLKLQRDPDTYPPSRYPWKGRTEPGKDFLDYLKG